MTLIGSCRPHLETGPDPALSAVFEAISLGKICRATTEPSCFNHPFTEISLRFRLMTARAGGCFRSPPIRPHRTLPGGSKLEHVPPDLAQSRPGTACRHGCGSAWPDRFLLLPDDPPVHPDMALLYSDLDPKDGGAIVRQLEEQKVPIRSMPRAPGSWCRPIRSDGFGW